MRTETQEAWLLFRADPGQDTFLPFYEATKGLAYTICRRILRDPEDAADAFQSAYGRLLAGDDEEVSGGEEEDAERLIRRLAAREATNLRMRRARRSRREIAMPTMSEKPDSAKGPDEEVAERELRDRVETLVLTLPERYQVPILLHYFHGMTQTDIAHALDSPVRTISGRIERGLKRLRPLMRRAGLGEALGVGGLALGVEILTPPASLCAASIFAQSQVFAGTAVVTSAAPLSKLVMGGAVVKGKVALIGVLIAFVFVYAVFLRDGADEVPGPVVATPVLVTPTPEPTPVAPVATPTPIVPVPTTTPLPTSNIIDGPTITISTTWKDNLLPVEGVAVQVTILEHIFDGKAPPPLLSGVTDKDGMVTLKCPLGRYTTKTASCGPRKFVYKPLSCRLETAYAGALPLSYKKLDLTSPFELALDRAYAFYGTVYWKPQGDAYVPAPWAEIVAVDAVGRREPKISSAMSNEEGRYEFHAAAASPLRLWGRLGKHVTVNRPAPVMPKQSEMSGPFDIYLEPGASLAVLVNDKVTLDPIEDATVEGNLIKSGLSFYARTDAEGFCNLEGLPVGPIKIVAGAAGYASDYAPLEISSDDNKNTIPFFLAKGGKVRVFTVNKTQESPVANVRFEITCGELNIPALSDASGVAIVEGIPLNQTCIVRPIGQHQRIWVAPSRNTIKKTNVFIPRFIAEADKMLDVILPVEAKISKGSMKFVRERWHNIEGTVVDESGAPVPGALVMTCSNRITASRPNKVGVTTLTNAAGEFRLENARLMVFPSRSNTIPKLEALGVKGIMYGGDIKLANKDHYVVRQGYVREDRAIVPYYVSPAILRVEAEGYSPISDFLAAINRKDRIKLIKEDTEKFIVRALDSATQKPIIDYMLYYNQKQVRTKFYMPSYPQKQVRIVSEDGRAFMTDLSSEKTYTFRIQAEGYVNKTSTWKPDEEGADFFLDRQTELKITVVDSETREPVSGVEVRYTRMPTRALEVTGISSSRPLNEIPYDRQLSTDSGGVFKLKTASSGGTLIFLPEAYTHFAIGLDNGNIEKYRGAETGEIVVPLEIASGSVTVRGTLGNEMVDEFKQTSLKSIGGTIHAPFPPPVFENGSYRWDNVPAGRYRIHGAIKAPYGYHNLRVSFDQSKAEDKSILLGENDFATLSGQLTRANGKPFTARTNIITLKTSGETKDRGLDYSYSSYSGSLDKNGVFLLEHLHPGDYTVSFYGTEFSKLIHIEGDVRMDFQIP